MIVSGPDGRFEIWDGDHSDDPNYREWVIYCGNSTKWMERFDEELKRQVSLFGKKQEDEL